MRVEVRLFANLARHRGGLASGEPFGVVLHNGASLVDLLHELAIPLEEVHLALIDGRMVRERSAPLAEGSRIGLFPPVGGG